MSVKQLKFKLDISLEKSCWLAIASMLAINNVKTVVISQFIHFIQFMISNHSTRQPNTSENFVTSLLAKMVKSGKLYCEVVNGINHYSINVSHNYYSTIKALPQISNNLKAMFNNFRMAQDNRVVKKAENIVKKNNVSTASKSDKVVVTTYKIESTKKRVVITSNLFERVVEVVGKNPYIEVKDIYKYLESIKPTSTTKKDFKSVINSILFKNLKKKIFAVRIVGIYPTNYHRQWLLI